MELEEILKNNFLFINKVFLEKEFNSLFLRIEVNSRNLNEIKEMSNKISLFLDEKKIIDKKYFLDIFSPGTDEGINPLESKKFIGENLQIFLKNKIKEKEYFIGELLSIDHQDILLKWNSKGQFRKQIINIDNIDSIKKYAKINKEKRN